MGWEVILDLMGSQLVRTDRGWHHRYAGQQRASPGNKLKSHGEVEDRKEVGKNKVLQQVKQLWRKTEVLQQAWEWG